MKLLAILLSIFMSIPFSYAQSNISIEQLDVTSDITADQYMTIKLFILAKGHIQSYSGIDDTPSYSFDNVVAYLNPCDLNQIQPVDSIMPEQAYCQLVFKLKFGSPMYNSEYQYLDLELAGDRVYLLPAYNDTESLLILKYENIVSIVEDIMKEIESID